MSTRARQHLPSHLLGPNTCCRWELQGDIRRYYIKRCPEWIAHGPKDYEEVIVPPAKTVPPRASERLVPCSELPPLAKASFPVGSFSTSPYPFFTRIQGYKTLNRIQSIVYPTAYRSNENMLICGAFLFPPSRPS